jgi:hypothetical protein
MPIIKLGGPQKFFSSKIVGLRASYVENQYSIADMAEVRPAGRMGPSNLFLRPLDPFRYLEKQTIQVHLNEI